MPIKVGRDAKNDPFDGAKKRTALDSMYV